MPALKVVKVRKEQDIPYGLPYALGLQILNLIKKGYVKFKIEDLGDAILITTWRIRKKEVESNE